jgi:hypothetical protein
VRSRRPRIACAALAQETTPGDGRRPEKEGKVVWYSVGRREGRRGDRQGVRAQYPKIHVEVERSGSERVLPAHQPGVPVEHQERRRGELLGRLALPLLEAAEVARAHTPPDARSSRPQYRDPEGYYALARDALVHGLQHQPR